MSIHVQTISELLHPNFKALLIYYTHNSNTLSSKLVANILPVDANDDISNGMVLDDIVNLVVLRVVAVPCLLVNWIWLVMLLGDPVAIVKHIWLHLYLVRYIQAKYILINICIRKEITSDISLWAKVNIHQQLIKIKLLRHENVNRNKTIKELNTKVRMLARFNLYYLINVILYLV